MKEFSKMYPNQKLSVKNVENVDLENKINKPNQFGHRHIQCILLFGGLLFNYFLRVNISVAIVAMVKPQQPNINDTRDITYFDWDINTKSLILSSFFWGYVVAQVPAGIFAQKYGAKLILAISSGICGLATLLIPIVAEYGDWQYVCAIRVIVGLTQGVVYPCVHTALAKWAPSTERGFLSSFVYSGAQLGTVIMLATSGLFSNSALGWPSIFYFSGAVTFCWSVGYFIFGCNSPDESTHIKKSELQYIQAYNKSNNNKDMKVPWKEIFTSVPFYALIFAHCGFTWGFYTLLTEIPTYLANVLEMDINKNALLSAVPYLTMWLLSLIISPISDYLINQKYITIEFSRKLFNSIGQWIPMICLIILGYMTKENTVVAIFLLTIAVGFNSASFVGYLVNHMDLSPNFSGHLMGITNGLSNLFALFAPIVVSLVVKHEHDPSEWRIVFFITAFSYLVCNLIFVIFGKTDLQKWNEPSDEVLTKNSTNNIIKENPDNNKENTHF